MWISSRLRLLEKLAIVAWAAAVPMLVASCKAQAPIRGVALHELDTPQFCAFGKSAYDRKPERCDLYTSHGAGISVGSPPDGIYQWRSEKGGIATFVGKRHPGGVPWWFGKLNGKRGAGYSMNRYHHIFVSSDGSYHFETWVQGWEGNSPFAVSQ